MRAQRLSLGAVLALGLSACLPNPQSVKERRENFDRAPLMGTLIFTSPPPGMLPCGAVFGDRIKLVGYKLDPVQPKRGDNVEVQHPASGLVSALEPVMRACSGTWVAHGSGSADREAVDEHDRVSVPPGEESYQLRRVWLTDAE